MKKALLFGIGASFFFSFTFVLNRQMNIGGGSWYWSSSLRYLFMLPILFFIVTDKKTIISSYKRYQKKSYSMVHMEYCRFWILLCSLKFCFSIWSFMASSWNLATNYNSRCSNVATFLHNN